MELLNFFNDPLRLQPSALLRTTANVVMAKVTRSFLFSLASVIWASSARSEKALESARCATVRAGLSATFSC